MRAGRQGRLLLAALAAAWLALGATTAGAITNGGFETGKFTDWKRNSKGAGHWKVYSGLGTGVAVPPQGTFAAQTVQLDPGSNVLYRNLRLKRGKHYTLSMQVYYLNTALTFVTPDSLGYQGAPNQQYRIDLVRRRAPLRSMKPSDILKNIFRTKVGDLLVSLPTPVSADISKFAGRTVRLRIAEVDNQSHFYAAIDAVKLKRG